jgi:glucose-1-phosphatase
MDQKLTFDAAIFDIGNVLLSFDFSHAFRQLGHAGVELIGGRADWKDLKNRYESGLVERLPFVTEAIRLIEFKGEAPDFMKIWQDIFTLNEPMWEVVATLRDRVPLYLLSNTNDLHVEIFTRQFTGFDAFKDAVYSHEVKLMKPDPAIFALAAQRFGVNPATTIYIDDLAENADAAREAGFISIQYDPKRHSDFLRELEKLGLRPE